MHATSLYLDTVHLIGGIIVALLLSGLLIIYVFNDSKKIAVSCVVIICLCVIAYEETLLIMQTGPELVFCDHGIMLRELGPLPWKEVQAIYIKTPKKQGPKYTILKIVLNPQSCWQPTYKKSTPVVVSTFYSPSKQICVRAYLNVTSKELKDLLITMVPKNIRIHYQSRWLGESQLIVRSRDELAFFMKNVSL